MVVKKEGGGAILPIVSNSGYTEFRYGIRDPERWFDVPDICKKVIIWP